MKAKELAEILLQNPYLEVMHDDEYGIGDVSICVVKIVPYATSENGCLFEHMHNRYYDINDQVTMDNLRDVEFIGRDLRQEYKDFTEDENRGHDLNEQTKKMLGTVEEYISRSKDDHDSNQIMLERVLAAPLSFMITSK